MPNPTLEDFRQSAVEDHAKFCGCSAQIGQRIWLANVFLPTSSTIGLDTSNFTEYGADTPLEALCNEFQMEDGRFNIIFDCGPSTDEEPLPKIEFRVVDDGPILEFNPRSSLARHLPTDKDLSYPTMVTYHDLLFVDKSAFVAPCYTQREPGRLPIIRRPKGFGKTTFLSVLETFVDIEHVHAPFPHAYDPPVYQEYPSRDYRKRLLILHLDLAHLVLSPTMSDADARASCRQLLSLAATTCYLRYAEYLQQPPEDKRDKLTLRDLLRLAYDPGRWFFVGIDNYTAPLAAVGSSSMFESIICSEIFEPIFRAWQSGDICRGLMVGDDLPRPGPWPYCESSSFTTFTHDLSYEGIAFEVLGLTEIDVEALGNALFSSGMNFLEQVRLQADVPDDEKLAGPLTTWRTYSVRDVLRLAEVLRTQPNALPTSLPGVNSVTVDDYPRPITFISASLWDELGDAVVESIDHSAASTKLRALAERLAAKRLASSMASGITQDEPASLDSPPRTKKRARTSDPISDQGSHTDEVGTIASFGSTEPSTPSSTSSVASKSPPGSPSNR